MVVQKRIDLTKEAILKHLTETDIIQGFWPSGKELKYNTGIISPFRQESDPSFIIGNKYGPITYKDMGAYEFRGSVWNFVKQIEGLSSLDQVLKAIDKRFNLGYSKGEIIQGKPVIEWEQPILIPKPPPIIQVSVRKFTKTELRWWSERYQDIEDLKREEIYAPATIWRNRQKIPIAEMTMCYYFPELGKWKLYRPLAPKKTKSTPFWQWKWDNSMSDITYIENLDKLKNSEIGIVIKSRKCRMLVRKATGIESICSIQAEDPSAMTDRDLQYIEQNCKQRIGIMDNDKKGLEMNYWLTNKGYKHCNVPYSLKDEYGATDFTDMAVATNIENVTKHFQDKGIIP